MERQVPVLRTVVPLRDYAHAVVRAWQHVGEGFPSKAAVAVLWAQYMIETGGRACWNWNIGNVKHVAGDGFDFHCLDGVWEGFAPDTARRLIDAGQAHWDPSADHAKAVGAGRVSILFDPPSPQTQFRAFGSLDEAMVDHLRLLAQKRFTSAWPAVLAGNCAAFALELKKHGYFTAAAEAYAAGMRPAFDDFMRSSGYDDALAEIKEVMDAVTQPELPNPPSDDTVVVDIDSPIIHPDVPMGRPWEM